MLSIIFIQHKTNDAKLLLVLINSDYPKLDHFFNPKSAIRSEGFTKFVYLFQTLYWLARFGPGRIRQAALMGQYFDPSGIYFGGLENQTETKPISRRWGRTSRSNAFKPLIKSCVASCCF